MDIILHHDKFHRRIYKFYRVTKIQKEDQTIRHLLCYYQELACKNYPSEEKMDAVLGRFYDAKFRVRLTNYGCYSLMEYSLSAIEPIFIQDESYQSEALEALFLKLIEPTFDPSVAEGLFERAYEIYESDLLMRQENYATVALQKALKEYFKGTDRDFDSTGSLKDLESITLEGLKGYYEKAKQEETLLLLCSLDEKQSRKTYSLTPKKDYHFKRRNNIRGRFYEDAPTEQCYLQVFYETKTYADDRLYYAMMFLNHLFGGSSSSKLFTIVREKYGLCYSINSMYLGASGILICSAIIEKKDVDATLKAMEEALTSIQKEEYDLEEVRKYYLSLHRGNEDYQETAINNYLSDHFFLDTPRSYLEEEAIQAVSKKDLQETFSRLEQTFVYVYGGGTDHGKTH